MAQVSDATGLYATLGYNFDDPNGSVTTLAAETQQTMSNLPPIITAWQAQDITNNSVGGYFQNPVATSVNTIITVSSQIRVLANSTTANDTTYTGSVDFGPMITAADALNSTAQSFLTHTDKVSGVTSISGQTDIETNPYYQTAVNYGKQAVYLTNQTDGVVNNSPIMGCMTSILVGPQISANASTLSADYVVLTNGINASNITINQADQITAHLTSTNSFLSGRQSNDVTFFGKVKSLVDNYNTTKPLTSMGETETFLCNNLIGTSKLVSRINS
jgi:hypothetical protein